ncbi:MAG: hypoxanthine phosphoribosyltransferase [Magnetococcales bacterium]|nr:hypoxanthine phosphoribosyltransferase [Magnetococcales bacterium]NGZ26886.1 hypoxanthine phosphoribosyltransferase [Magnetococcales bacterium]
MNYRVEPLISQEKLAIAVDRLAAEAASLLEGETVVIGLFKGAFIFTADLVRALSRHGVEPRLDFLVLSSYGNATESSGKVTILMDCREDIRGRQVLLVDDILDSGNTLAFTVDYLMQKGAAKVLTCVLLDKPQRRTVRFEADLVGFTIPNTFVVGYGIDYAERHRELPFVGMVRFDGEKEETP